MKLYTLLLMLLVAVTGKAESRQWWGYMNQNDSRTGLGVQAIDTYHCAVFIPGDHLIAGGKTIQAIRFGMRANNAVDAKVWIASSLPDDMAGEEVITSIDVDDALLSNTDIEVALPTPYPIPTEGVYVGYSFSVTVAKKVNDLYPVVVSREGGTPHSLWMRTENTTGEWQDRSDEGKLMLQVLLEGTFAEHIALPGTVDPLMAWEGDMTEAQLPVTNMGVSPLTSIDYTVTIGGEPGAVQHAELPNAVDFCQTGLATVQIPTERVQSKVEKQLTITKVNGQANDLVDGSTPILFYTVTDHIDRQVVVEEYTGTGCGYCPRGLVGMEKLRNTFGESFAGIAIHQYNATDAMYIPTDAYADLQFMQAPMCKINRTVETDPYYGSEGSICDNVSAALAQPTRCRVEVSGTLCEVSGEWNTVEATASVQSLFDEQVSLEFVLVADGLTGTGSSWVQSNYYNTYNPSELPDDLQPFAEGGVYGTSKVRGLTYNDVAIASSYAEGRNQVADLSLTAGETQEVAFTLSLPTKAELKEALHADALYVIALVTDEMGHILNASKQPVDATQASVGGVERQDTSQAVTGCYTLDGQRLAQTRRGVNLVRTADGKTHKVVVR